ncbi:MAG: hypothetical protein JWO67_5086 [Streptosporangiaceae bacterium]|jgi:fructoselysine 6-kinase|nr:hypothetical protein [Streptosporangiaceae bacterium]
MGSVGDNVVDRYLESRLMYPGGGAVNVAVHAQRSGAQASYLGLLGSDWMGDIVLEALASERVDVSRARRVAGPNAATDVSISAAGDRSFASHRKVDAVLELTADDCAYLGQADWVYTNYSSDAEALVPTLAGLAPLAFDFSYKDEAYAAPLLPHVTLAAFSRSFLEDDELLDLVRRTQARGTRCVLVTRGAAGALVAVDDEVVYQPALPVTIVDTLGAGDAFLARFACGLFGGETPAVAAAAAARAAAAVCATAGAFGHPRPLTPAAQERNELGTRS